VGAARQRRLADRLAVCWLSRLLQIHMSIRPDSGVLSQDSGVLTDSGRSEAAASRGQTRGVLAVEAVADSHEHPTGFRCLWLTWDLAPNVAATMTVT